MVSNKTSPNSIPKSIPQIKKELIDTGKVLYNLRDYPLSFHRTAKDAAIAAFQINNPGRSQDNIPSDSGALLSSNSNI